MRVFMLASATGNIKVSIPGPVPSENRMVQLRNYFNPILCPRNIQCDECGGHDLHTNGSAIFEVQNILLDARFTCQGCGHEMHYVISSDPAKMENPGGLEV